MKRTGIAAMALAGLVAIFCGQALGQTGIVDSAKNIMKDRQDSIVRITAVGKIVATKAGVEVGKQEVKVETLGTVIDKSGMIVVAYSHVDTTIPMDVGNQQVQLTNDISDVKIRLADGTELPASIVMKDLDLDLAFIKPDGNDEAVKKAKFTPVDLSNAGTAEILDEVVVLSRLGKNMNDAPAVTLMRIASIISKPRKYYIPGGSIGGGLPIFTADGKILGISVYRKVAKMLVILPAKDVLEIAKQALEKSPGESTPAKPDAEKKEPAKTPAKPVN